MESVNDFARYSQKRAKCDPEPTLAITCEGVGRAAASAPGHFIGPNHLTEECFCQINSVRSDFNLTYIEFF